MLWLVQYAYYPFHRSVMRLLLVGLMLVTGACEFATDPDKAQLATPNALSTTSTEFYSSSRTSVILRPDGGYDTLHIEFHVTCKALACGFRDKSWASLPMSRAEWIFGDGTKAIQNSARHTYPAAG